MLASHLYPYFSSALSRKALLSGSNVPVQSCWNGIGKLCMTGTRCQLADDTTVAFDASPFQRPVNPLVFRGIPDSLAQYHVEASECCLIHYDNPLSAPNGVYINPAVRVAYSAPAYAAVSSTRNGDRPKNEWPTKSELFWGHWKRRWLWWARLPASAIKIWWRIKRWRSRYPNIDEPGLACASDLAMVLKSNGWAMRGGRFE